MARRVCEQESPAGYIERIRTQRGGTLSLPSYTRARSASWVLTTIAKSAVIWSTHGENSSAGVMMMVCQGDYGCNVHIVRAIDIRLGVHNMLTRNWLRTDEDTLESR